MGTGCQEVKKLTRYTVVKPQAKSLPMTTWKAYYVPDTLVSLGGKAVKQILCWLLLATYDKVLQEREVLKVEVVRLLQKKNEKINSTKPGICRPGIDNYLSTSSCKKIKYGNALNHKDQLRPNFVSRIKSKLKIYELTKEALLKCFQLF